MNWWLIFFFFFHDTNRWWRSGLFSKQVQGFQSIIIFLCERRLIISSERRLIIHSHVRMTQLAQIPFRKLDPNPSCPAWPFIFPLIFGLIVSSTTMKGGDKYPETGSPEDWLPWYFTNQLNIGLCILILMLVIRKERGVKELLLAKKLV